jgi:parallel beta-helix repeat protein
MQVHHTWQQGILVNGDYNRVENSKVWQCARANSTNGSVGTGGWGTGMSAARNPISGITHYATFRHNTVYNNWGEGLSCFEADHCVMEDNVVYDNWTVNIYLSDASNSIVRRNLVYISSNPAIPQRNNNKVGILLADEVASVPRSKNNRLINNLIYNANFAAFSWTGVYGSGLEGVLIANNTLVNGEFSLSAGGAMAITHHNTQIVNNIFQGNRNSVSSTSGVSFSNNNWLVAPPAVASSVGDVLGDALLQKTGTTTAGTLKADYFKLLSNSPLIDRGLPLLTVTTDYFKQPRTLFPDIGAHEFKK